jgi:hypothetical protein
MVRRVSVVPQRAGMGLRHPIDGLLEDAGSDWTMDQFTALLLRDGAIIEKMVTGANKTAVFESREAFDRNNTDDRV